MSDIHRRITEYVDGNPAITNVTINYGADYDDGFDPFVIIPAREAPVKQGIDKVEVELRRVNAEEASDALHGIADAMSGTTGGLPKPYRVHMNDPWTVIEWEDGTKSKIKCHEEDTYNPLHGIIRNIIRKVGKNHVRVDAWEPLISQMADFIEGPDETAFLEAVLYVLTETMVLPGAMERLADYDVRNDETTCADPYDKAYEAIMAKTQEEMRQVIRNLTLEGEL